jgi:hypothetical protein
MSVPPSCKFPANRVSSLFVVIVSVLLSTSEGIVHPKYHSSMSTIHSNKRCRCGVLFQSARALQSHQHLCDYCFTHEEDSSCDVTPPSPTCRTPSNQPSTIHSPTGPPGGLYEDTQIENNEDIDDDFYSTTSNIQDIDFPDEDFRSTTLFDHDSPYESDIEEDSQSASLHNVQPASTVETGHAQLSPTPPIPHNIQLVSLLNTNHQQPDDDIRLEEAIDDHPNPYVMSELASGEPFHIPPDYFQSTTTYTNADQSMLRLYSTCDKAGAPRYLLDEILSQLKHEIRFNGFDLLSGSLTKRDPFMKRIARITPSPPPETITVQLESNTLTNIQRFDFLKSLQCHLLRSDLYGNLDQLVVNKTDRWLPPIWDGTMNGDITDGKWHQRTFRNLPVPPNDPYQPFHLGLRIYTDKTGNDTRESFALEPVVMSTTLLKEDFNSDATSFFTLGYIPDLSNTVSSAKRKAFGETVRDYHKCLGIFLAQLSHFQKESWVTKYVEFGSTFTLLFFLVTSKVMMCFVPV